MAELAIIEDGKVVNRIIGEPGFAGGIECAAEVRIGWSYDGATFTPPPRPEPEPERRMVFKSLIVQRLIDADKIGAANDALEANASAKARWYAPDKGAIYHDDPEAVAFLEDIGADPEVILAP